MSYARIVQQLPKEWQLPMLELVEAVEDNMRSQLAVRRQDFEQLSDTVRALAEAQQRTEVRLEQLAEAQQRTEARLEQLAEAQQRTEARLEQLAEAQQRTEVRLEQLAEAQQRTEARVEQLAEAQQRTEARVEQLAEAQQRTEARLEQLVEAQQRTEARVERLETTVQALVEAQHSTTLQLKDLSFEVRELVGWQRGEAGRREGERYERLLLKRAPALFAGGQGGATDQHHVQQHLVEKLLPHVALDALADDENPFLADLIWWKGDQYLVVEASIKVNGKDVRRAARRAETLRKAQMQAVGVVVGKAWVGEEARQQAQERGVEWRVGDDVSQGVLTFRRLPGKDAGE